MSLLPQFLANPFGRAGRSISTILSADEILHHGEVVKRHTRGALVRKARIYEKLWRLQLGEGKSLTPSAGDRLPPVGAVR